MVVRAELEPDTGKIWIESEWRWKEVISTLPGAKWSTDESKWFIPVSWSACLAIRSTFKEELEIGPVLADWATAQREEWIDDCTKIRLATDWPEAEDGSDKHLYWWQRSGSEFIKTGKRVLILDDPGAGKAQPLSEPVLTPKGFVPMGEIKVGDEVVGSNGLPTKVWGVYKQGVRPVYKVSFSDGTHTFADENHLWKVQSKRDSKTGNWQVLSTRDILDRGTHLISTKHGSASKWRIPLCQPVEFEAGSNNFTIDPWALGALLGDGTLGLKGVVFTSADDELVEKMRHSIADLAEMRKIQDEYSYSLAGLRVGKNELLDVLRDLGISGKRSFEKSVPNAYLMAPPEVRLQVLQGLMDTDGYAGKNNQQIYTTVSPKLAEDVAFLVRSLGGRAVVKEKGTIPVGGNYMPINITIRMPKGVNPFSLSRKAALVDVDPHFRLAKFISSIEYSHDEETQCIAVEADDRLYLTRDFIVTHNTLTTITGIQKLFIAGEDVFPILVVAPTSMKRTWKREFEQWWPGMIVQVVSGSAARRKKQLATPAHVYVMNFESIKSHSRLAPYGSIAMKRCPEHGGKDPKVTAGRCEVHIKELNHIKFGSAIIDEIHRCKDPKSQQSRALLSALGDTPIRIGLTGTPIANNVVDLWSLFHLLDPKEFPSKTRWIERFVETMPNPFGGLVVIGIKADRRAEFDAVHNPRMRRMTEDQVLDFLPPIIYERRDCEMSPKQAKAYKEMKEEMIAKLEDGSTVVTTSPMTQAARLLQFASSYCEVETFEEVDEHGFSKISQKTTLVEPSAKLDVFMEDVENKFGDHQVAVMAVSRQLLELMSRRLDKAGIKHGMITGTTPEEARQWYMEEFQAGRLQYILFTSGAGGTGITLTAARYLARLQIPFSFIDYVQTLRRVRRIGAERHENIMVLDYVSTDTADEGVFEVVFKKEMNFQDIVKDNEALKRFLKEEE